MRKPPLTPGRIVEAAVVFADEVGTDPLTMRTLAARLDTGAMSLYNHVAGKFDLIDRMVDHICTEVTVPPAGTHWKVAARDLAVSAHQVLQRHPWAVEFWATRLPGPNRLRLMEALLGTLATAQLTSDHADLGFHAIINHIQGFAERSVGKAATVHDEDPAIDLSTFPRVVAHVRFHQGNPRAEDEFGFVLDLILDGLARSATAGSA